MRLKKPHLPLFERNNSVYEQPHFKNELIADRLPTLEDKKHKNSIIHYEYDYPR